MPPIIDADCHISPTPQGGNSISYDELLRRMDRSGVDQALTWLQPPYERGELAAGNAYVAEAVKAHPDRILGFGWADPNLGVDRALEAVDRCLHDYGFPGVKLNGAQNEFVIDDSKLVLPVVEKIAAAGAILALHIGGDSPENTHPWRAGNIARRYPELRMLIVHIGGAAFHDLSRATIEVAAGAPQYDPDRQRRPLAVDSQSHHHPRSPAGLLRQRYALRVDARRNGKVPRTAGG